MILFESTDFESLNTEFQIRSNEISIEVLRKICKVAHDSSIEKIVIGAVPKLDFELVIGRSEFISSLEKNLSRVEEEEEYELCARAVECIEYLKSIDGSVTMA
jgi:hypothetical protein